MENTGLKGDRGFHTHWASLPPPPHTHTQLTEKQEQDTLPAGIQDSLGQGRDFPALASSLFTSHYTPPAMQWPWDLLCV